MHQSAAACRSPWDQQDPHTSPAPCFLPPFLAQPWQWSLWVPQLSMHWCIEVWYYQSMLFHICSYLMPNSIFGAMGKTIHFTGISITSAPDFQVEVGPQATKSETRAGASIGLGLRAGSGGHSKCANGKHFPNSFVWGYPQIPWFIIILPRWRRLRIGKYFIFRAPAWFFLKSVGTCADKAHKASSCCKAPQSDRIDSAFLHFTACSSQQLSQHGSTQPMETQMQGTSPLHQSVTRSYSKIGKALTECYQETPTFPGKSLLICWLRVERCNKGVSLGLLFQFSSVTRTHKIHTPQNKNQKSERMNVLLYYAWLRAFSPFLAANICFGVHMWCFSLGPMKSETVLVMSFSVAVLWRGVCMHIIAVGHPP